MIKNFYNKIRNISQKNFYAFFNTFAVVYIFFKKIDMWLNGIYLNSAIYSFFSIGKQELKLGLKYSIFSKLSNIEGFADDNVLSHSIVSNAVVRSYKACINRLNCYLYNSKLFTLTMKLPEHFEKHPLKIGGWAVIIMVIVNLILGVVLDKNTNMFFFVLKITLFSIGVVCLFSDINWEMLRKNSFVLKKKNDFQKN